MASWQGDLDTQGANLDTQGANLDTQGANMESGQVPSREPEMEAPEKVYTMSLERVIKAVCIIGSTVLIDVTGQAPDGYNTFEASASPGLLFHVKGTKFNFGSGHTSRWYLHPSCELKLNALVPSSTMFSEWVRITYFKYGEECSSLVALMKVTCIVLSLTGEKRKKEPENKNKKREEKRKELLEKNAQNSWDGPIMLVNCRCNNEYPPRFDDQEEEILYIDDVNRLAKVFLDIRAPFQFFMTHQIVISCTHPDKVRLFGSEGSSINVHYKLVLGPNRPRHTIKHLRYREKRVFYVEALCFPDADFSGMISFTASLLNTFRKKEPEYPIYNVGEAFRVAPWIMLSNIQPPVEIFVTRLIPESTFIKTISNFAHEANCDLTFCPDDRIRLETWIGKEVAIGYTQSPECRFPVMLDTPCKCDLNFVFKKNLSSVFGYVIHEREREDDDDLDLPGFLAVSPPVTAHGIIYPLGRILIGNGSLPRENIAEVNRRLRSFIYAQNIQHPLELFSEWLLEGNVKEFLTFVPANDRQGFRLLLASPNACYELFKREKRRGYGKASVLDRVDRNLLFYTERVKMSISDILADKFLRRQNDYAQTCIDWNRRVLKAELGLSERDIIDIPQLFRLGWVKDPSTQQQVLRAGHLFPNMLNMIVLGTNLGIPKPFGPLINGFCCLEKRVRNLLEPLGLNCLFIEEFFGHQEDWGDAYYWINIVRRPLKSKWWTVIT